MPPAERREPPLRTRGRRLAPLAAAAAAFAAVLLLHAGGHLLYDADAEYHLAIGRAYAERGLVDELPWARFSLMREGFGDKELLFHLLLAPFAALPDPLAGGRLALALLWAALAAAVAGLATRAVGWWGALVPLWLVWASTEHAWRLVRLRPELLSLLLLLAALWAIARRRDLLLGLIALLYALSYTAFHAFLGVVVLASLACSWPRRRLEWRGPLWALLGVGLGLVVHPHFPHNLEVWVAQSVDFFRLKGRLDVGTEIRPNFTDVALMVNLGWLLGLAALWRSAVPGDPPTEEEARAADAFGAAAAAFGLLYLLMSRFSLYAVPFATLWLLFELRRRGLVPGRWVRLPRRGRVPLAAALALALLVSLPEAVRQLRTFRERTAPGPGDARLADRAALARALPAGARVAAPWRSTPIYMLAAPQALYLNVLDPVFMALPHPRAYELQRRVFDGTEPDVPLAAVAGLASEIVAFPRTEEHATLLARLAADPRARPLHQGLAVAFRVDGAAAGFALDWRVVPAGAAMPPPAGAPIDAWPAWPRPPLGSPARGVEGYVDARRETGGTAAGCVGFARIEETTAPVELDVELAPYGPMSVWLDGRPVASTGGAPRAVLGGFRLPLALASGRHLIAVLTCPAGSPAHVGFYWLERGRRASQGGS